MMISMLLKILLVTSESSLQSHPPPTRTPVRHFSNHCFICSFLLPLLFLFPALPISSGNIPMCFSCAPFPSRPPIPPPPVLRAGGRSAITHHLVITVQRGPWWPCCSRSMCIATGERLEESLPPIPIPSSPHLHLLRR